MRQYPMFDGLDPYDKLVIMDERLSNLELAHNNLANAYRKQYEDLNTTMISLSTLQKAHLNLSQSFELVSMLRNMAEEELATLKQRQK
ncbi:hypothetical protein UFOVP641_16 [uncultured Caudovirales phage]|uniref:Uncharacterized protein n=1 Tax=uncultured Caudovirales phage TaxID=2100421 RepID=A0A6J5N225_9CAUD|nr:hypothetical protein UFOVP641_16 [uncultured Caudovirales phage]